MATVEEQFNQATAEAWIANVKAGYEALLQDVKREQEYNDGWKALSLRQAEQNQQIVNRLANEHATLSARIANDAATVSARLASNAATLDNIVSAGAVTNPAELAETAIGAKVTDQVRNAVDKAFETATVAAAQASPLPQGTTGVAQGSMQAANAASVDAMMTQLAVANSAIMAQVVKLAEVVGVLYVKVVGDQVVPKPSG